MLSTEFHPTAWDGCYCSQCEDARACVPWEPTDDLGEEGDEPVQVEPGLTC